MKIILDTCTFLWITADSKHLSKEARRVFSSAENDIYLSASSVWEISVKCSAGKLKLPEPSWTFVPKQRKLHGIEVLEIGEGAALYEPRLPKLHSDPFDRMLICQAIDEGCALLTPDEMISQYPVRVIW